MSETVGAYLARARKAAGLSLRQLSEKVGGLSVPYLHDVEHDRRRLVAARWGSFAAALPGVTIREIAERSFSSGPVEIDARLLTERQRKALVEALVSEVTQASAA